MELDRHALQHELRFRSYESELAEDALHDRCRGPAWQREVACARAAIVEIGAPAPHERSLQMSAPDARKKRRFEELEAFASERPAGSKVKLEVWRNRQSISIELPL